MSPQHHTNQRGCVLRPSSLLLPASQSLIMAAVSSNPITQVSQTLPQPNLQPQLLTRLQLDLRGARFNVDRETIMNLPESVLLCLFPNGLVLSRQSVALSDGGEDEDDEIYGVDVRVCLIYFLALAKQESCSISPTHFCTHSLTPSASDSYCLSSALPPTISMVPLPTLVFFPSSSTSSIPFPLPLRQISSHPLKTLSSQNKL
jgi:hypothetical protein